MIIFNYGALRLKTSIRRLFHPWHFMLWCVNTCWQLTETQPVINNKQAVPTYVGVIRNNSPP